MTYIRGKNVLMFITTEGAGCIDLSTAAPTVSTATTVGLSNTTVGIGKLGQVTAASNTTDKVKFVEGVDVTMAWEDEQATFFGGAKEYNIPHRKKFEVSITRKPEDKVFEKLACWARFGINGTTSAALNSGVEERTSMSGYRIYLYDGTNWDIFYHAELPADGYKPALDPAKATTETIKFVGNEWSSSVAVASISASLAIE